MEAESEVRAAAKEVEATQEVEGSETDVDAEVDNEDDDEDDVPVTAQEAAADVDTEEESTADVAGLARSSRPNIINISPSLLRPRISPVSGETLAPQ